ncbi:DNA methyltransferase [Cupriavidus gilardii]|uniref:DNA methyltransferase n=1 Tax=Cupriavidus gilardii TaxID=82541 RepID=UPI001573F8D4|nr:DNA methyltransferase [Cupriavidus gilardii]NSX05680.1 hypothetical protein [Cupriavidus gilardii]
MSSEDIRGLLGLQTYSALKAASEADGVGPSAYIIASLRKRLAIGDHLAPQQQLELDSFVDPVHVTFRGGAPEPLHSWFPYLEGYSPAFVRAILEEYCPDAQTIFEPFAGTGTTLYAAAKNSKQVLFSEVNPLMTHVIAAKVAAFTISAKQRIALADSLEEVAHDVHAWPCKFAPDKDLGESFRHIFGDSRYFEADALKEVLIARAALNYLQQRLPHVYLPVSVAVVSCLLPCSNLIRRGDVRFKTPKELEKGVPSLLAETRAKLLVMAQDLRTVTTLPGVIKHVCDDARSLGKLPPLSIDAVITSPPYLNGTNYIRNTKIELWFLRLLSADGDLRRLRTKTITSGINDVNRDRTEVGGLPRSVVDIARRLDDAAYDVRIPKMVTGYFADLQRVFEGVSRHIRSGGTVAIDIGDSEYAGIHVPTDRLIVDVFNGLGFELDSEVMLRQRKSRSGRPLRQSLLIFKNRKPKRPRASKQALPRELDERWSTFKTELPHQRGEFAKRNWGHPLHSLCSYQGKMKPSLAAKLIEAFLPKSGRVLDPFGGVGTIPFEAALAGHQSFSFDISPSALPIARAKIEGFDGDSCERVLRELEDHIENGNVPDSVLQEASAIGFNGKIPEYYSQQTFKEILLARQFFMERGYSTGHESLVLSALLHILHGNRPYALSRNSHPITPFAPTGEFEYRALMPRLRQKVRRSLEAPHPQSFVAGRVIEQDATGHWPLYVDQLDAVITSPPFFDSTRFHLANWLRLWFAGWSAVDFSLRPQSFVDELQKLDLAVYDPILRQARERLKAGGVLVMHLGKSKKCDMGAELQRRARRFFNVADLFDETVGHCESHGIRDKGTVTSHQYLVLI